MQAAAEVGESQLSSLMILRFTGSIVELAATRCCYRLGLARIDARTSDHFHEVRHVELGGAGAAQADLEAFATRTRWSERSLPCMSTSRRSRSCASVQAAALQTPAASALGRFRLAL